jgi:hypothetical protein
MPIPSPQAPIGGLHTRRESKKPRRSFSTLLLLFWGKYDSSFTWTTGFREKILDKRDGGCQADFRKFKGERRRGSGVLKQGHNMGRKWKSGRGFVFLKRFFGYDSSRPHIADLGAIFRDSIH